MMPIKVKLEWVPVRDGGRKTIIREGPYSVDSIWPGGGVEERSVVLQITDDGPTPTSQYALFRFRDHMVNQHISEIGWLLNRGYRFVLKEGARTVAFCTILEGLEGLEVPALHRGKDP